MFFDKLLYLSMASHIRMVYMSAQKSLRNCSTLITVTVVSPRLVTIITNPRPLHISFAEFVTLHRNKESIENVEPKNIISYITKSSKLSKSNSDLNLTSVNEKLKKKVKIDDNEYIKKKIETAIKNLKEILPISTAQAKIILKKYPKFLDVDASSISQTLIYLSSHKYPLSKVVKNPWLLFIPPDKLDVKVKEVRTILEIHDVQIAIPFTKLRTSKLNSIKALWIEESENFHTLRNKTRLQYLAEQLECSEADVADILTKMENLPTIPFSRIERIVTILLDGGVRKVDILSDPWIFEHNIERMQERLRSSRERGISVIKPWVLRSPPSIYEYFVSRTIREKVLLEGHKDLESFLQQKLGCTRASAKEILFRVPSVKTASAIKLNEMIDFLYSEGFNAEHILETPRILGHSVETISLRTKELSTFGYIPDSLSVLCKTSKHYSTFIRRFTKHKTKKASLEEKDKFAEIASPKHKIIT